MATRIVFHLRLCSLVCFALISWGLSIHAPRPQNIHYVGQPEEPVRYDGYQLWRVVPETNFEMTQLDLFKSKYNLSFWRAASTPGRPVDVMIPPALVYRLAPLFDKTFPSFKLLQSDIQLLIDEQYADRAKPSDEFAYDKYHRLEEIERWIDDMVATYPNLASKDVIGTSFEGRKMNFLKISTGARNSLNGTDRSEKKGVFIEGGIHAREWISPATVIYMTNQLLKEYGTNHDVTTILDTFDWFILPVFNVDGYEFTWTFDRLWRKTRSFTEIPLCRGVDPNRNWDNHWGGNGSSSDPCSDSYHGPKAFSEVEVKAVADFLLSRQFAGFIDFHSYSQLWMTAWGWTTDLPPDFSTQDAQSAACVKALEAVHGTVYEHGTIANIIYISSGSSVDWTYADAGVLFSAGVELRDKGQYGFLLPADQIIPSGQETFAALVQFALFIINNSK